MENIELLEKFFSDSLSNEEQNLFNKRLREDEDFREEYLFQKDLKKALLAGQRKELKSTLQGFERDLKKEKKSFPINKWLIAASIVILLGIGYLMSVGSKRSNEQLYASYFEPYRNVLVPVVRGEKDLSIKAKAFNAYENKKYFKAINLFNSVKENDKTSVNFYKAMSFMALNKNEEAIELLLPIATSGSDDPYEFVQKANWYLGLAYLNAGETSKAFSQFSMIVNNDSMNFKKKEAAELLEEIK